MKKMLDNIQCSLDNIYTIGVEIAGKYNSECIFENANGESETLDEFRIYWHNKLDKLQAIYRAWSIDNSKINIEKFYQ